MSAEMAREMALLREVLEEARLERDAHQACWHAMWKERDEARDFARSVYRWGPRIQHAGWEEAHPWLNEPRVTPPPDTPSSPEDVDRITGAARCATVGYRLARLERDHVDCVNGLNEQTRALRERVTALEDRRGALEYNLKNIFDRLDTFEYNEECIFERLRALEERPQVGRVVNEKAEWE